LAVIRLDTYKYTINTLYIRHQKLIKSRTAPSKTFHQNSSTT